MFKFIGFMVVVVGLCTAVAVVTGLLDLSVQSNLTPAGQHQVQSLREKAADQIRGK